MGTQLRINVVNIIRVGEKSWLQNLFFHVVAAILNAFPPTMN